MPGIVASDCCTSGQLGFDQPCGSAGWTVMVCEKKGVCMLLATGVKSRSGKFSGMGLHKMGVTSRSILVTNSVEAHHGA